MSLQTQISKMSASELNEIVELVKLRRTYISKTVTKTLVIGDNVTFDSGRTYGKVTGKVSKVNIKTVAVKDTHNGLTWKVTASLLTKV
jgi:hypothetical protein